MKRYVLELAQLIFRHTLANIHINQQNICLIISDIFYSVAAIKSEEEGENI